MSTVAIRAAGVAPAKTGDGLRATFLQVSVGFGVYAACQWATIAVLAKLGSPELVGQYAFALALTTPVLMLAQMSLRSVLATDITEVHDFRDYRNLRFGMLSLAMAGICVIAPGAGVDHSRSVVIVLVGLLQAGEWAADVFYGRMQQQDRTERMAVSLAARGLLGIVALALALGWSGNLALALAWMLLARTAVYFVYDSTYALRNIQEQRTRGTWRRQAAAQWAIFKQSLPLGIVLMLGAMVISAPRYLVAHSLGERELGVFSAICSLATAGNLLVNSLGQAATPRLARLYAAGDAHGFRALSLKMAGLGAVLGLVGLLGVITLGPFVITLVYRPEYARQASLLTVAMAAAGAGFVASLLGYAITAARRFREQMPLQAACLAATLLSAYLLIPRMGLIGAAVSAGIGSIVQIAAEAWIWRNVLISMTEEVTP
jgi:O-antigen/teichoic acid export membrane protein